MCHPCWDYILLYIGFTSYGAVGPVQPFTSNCLIFWSFLFRDTQILQTLAFETMWLCTQKELYRPIALSQLLHEFHIIAHHCRYRRCGREGDLLSQLL